MERVLQFLKKLKRINIRFAGQGGQGIILMAYLFGKGAIYTNSLYAVQTQKYGPESRGTPVKSDLVISKTPVRFPLFNEIDVLVAMNQETYDRNHYKVKPSGLIVLDSTMIKIKHEEPNTYEIPATEIANKEFKNEMVANVIMLGFLNKLMGTYIKNEAMKEAIKESVKRDYRDLNLEAYQRGLEWPL